MDVCYVSFNTRGEGATCVQLLNSLKDSSTCRLPSPQTSSTLSRSSSLVLGSGKPQEHSVRLVPVESSRHCHAYLVVSTKLHRSYCCLKTYFDDTLQTGQQCNACHCTPHAKHPQHNQQKVLSNGISCFCARCDVRLHDVSCALRRL